MAKRKKSELLSDQVIEFIQKRCFVPEGSKIGQQVKLEEFQIKAIRKIYDNPAGTRRAILSYGRKNGKTSFSACLLLAHLCGPCRQPNSQLYSTAQSRDQAAVLFNCAAKMVRLEPIMRQTITIRETAKELVCPDMGSRYRALSAEATTAFGLSPSFIVHDELGQVKGPRSPLYEALETATGAQAHPLSIIISSQAPNDQDLLSVLIDDAREESDPRTVLDLYEAEETLDPFARETIAKANPALGVFLNEREVLAMAEDARRMPAREPEFRNLVLNQRVLAESPFITPGMWQMCSGEPQKLMNTSTPVYAGLDLSEVADLTALVLIGKTGGKWSIHPTFWLPEHGLAEKAKQDRVPYDLWHRDGFLETTPGNTVSYEYVARELYTVFARYNIRKLGFDRWNFKHLKPWLLQAGFSEHFIADRFVEFGQGTASMSPALRELEAAIRDKNIAHGNHPILTYCMTNAVVEGKDSANRKLSKSKSNGRIDGAVALAMAIGVAPLHVSIDVGALIG